MKDSMLIAQEMVLNWRDWLPELAGLTVDRAEVLKDLLQGVIADACYEFDQVEQGIVGDFTPRERRALTPVLKQIEDTFNHYQSQQSDFRAMPEFWKDDIDVDDEILDKLDDKISEIFFSGINSVAHYLKCLKVD